MKKKKRLDMFRGHARISQMEITDIQCPRLWLPHIIGMAWRYGRAISRIRKSSFRLEPYVTICTDPRLCDFDFCSDNKL